MQKMHLAVLLLSALVCSAPLCNGVGIRCAKHCTFYGRNIISCEQASTTSITQCFDKYPDATVLDLGFTKLYHVNKPLFHGLHRIKRLYLDHTHPNTVDEDSFQDLSDLQAVSLRSVGRAVTMFGPALTKCETLLSVNMAGNFDNCSCDWLSLVEDLKQHSIIIEDLSDTPRCTDEDTQACIENESRRSTPGNLKYLIAGAAGGLVVIVITVTLILRFCCPKLFKKKDPEEGDAGDGEVSEYEKLFEETTAHLKKMNESTSNVGENLKKMAEDTMKKLGTAQLLSSANKEGTDEVKKKKKKTKNTSDHIHADKEGEEIREAFLDELAKRRSMHSSCDSDSDDEEMRQLLIDPLGKSNKSIVSAISAPINNILSKVGGVFSKKSELRQEVGSVFSRKSELGKSIMSMVSRKTSAESYGSAAKRSGTSVTEKDSKMSADGSEDSEADSKSSSSSMASGSDVSGTVSGSGQSLSDRSSVSYSSSNTSLGGKSNTSMNNNSGESTRSSIRSLHEIVKSSANPTDAPSVDSILASDGATPSNAAIGSTVQSKASIGARSTGSKPSKRTIVSDAELFELLIEWSEDQ